LGRIKQRLLTQLLADYKHWLAQNTEPAVVAPLPGALVVEG
jgi:hypothetical protein